MQQLICPKKQKSWLDECCHHVSYYRSNEIHSQLSLSRSCMPSSPAALLTLRKYVFKEISQKLLCPKQKPINDSEHAAFLVNLYFILAANNRQIKTKWKMPCASKHLSKLTYNVQFQIVHVDF